ncbi:Efr3p [Malassezia vespertilionis]|uniref:Efr3p n=1 Tax=Malassezia vespertilionis TaxID=2020962 RepID=A0A2N1J6X4_9BASI|nr:Efr3p [Malassezia vespertilionis]
MLCIPKSNHKKLVEDCYPASKALESTAPEYRPNSNELGRLCYYAARKPAKLTKVGHLLAVRIALDARSLRSVRTEKIKAALMITLGILKELAATGQNGLPYLAQAAQLVLSESIQAAEPNVTNGTWDTDIIGRVATTFSAFVRETPASMLEVDENVARCVFTVLTQVQPLVGSMVDEHTRLVGLGAMAGVVESPVLYTSAFSRFTELMLPSILDTISLKHIPLEVLASHTSRTEGIPTLSSTADANAETTACAALLLLSYIAQGADANQLRTLVCQITRFLDTSAQDMYTNEEWFPWLMGMITNWATPASRYVIPHTLVNILDTSSIPGGRDVRLLQALHLILVDGTEVVGLNMTELLDGHLQFLLVHVQRDAQDPIIGSTIEAIGRLAQHTMYADQLADFVRQINARIIVLQNVSAKLTQLQRDESIRALLFSLIAIFCATPTERISAPVSLSVWDGTESLLLADNAAVRVTYLQTLLIYLDICTKRKMQVVQGEARYAPLGDGIRFLYALIANAYVNLSRLMLAPGSQEAARAMELSKGRYNIDSINAIPADYAAFLAVLESLYTTHPASALLASVPALLALDRVASTSTGALAQRRACRWVVGRALCKLGVIWDAQRLVLFAQQHVLVHVQDMLLSMPTLEAQYQPEPVFDMFGDGVGSSFEAVSDLDATAELLAQSATLQVAANCSEAALRQWLLRAWTVSVGIQDAEIGALPFGEARMRAASPQLATQSASSPLKREDTMNVSDLRMALMRHGAASQPSQAHANLKSERRRTQSMLGSPVDLRPSVSSLMDKYQVSKGVPSSEQHNYALPASARSADVDATVSGALYSQRAVPVV